MRTVGGSRATLLVLVLLLPLLPTSFVGGAVTAPDMSTFAPVPGHPDRVSAAGPTGAAALGAWLDAPLPADPRSEDLRTWLGATPPDEPARLIAAWRDFPAGHDPAAPHAALVAATEALGVTVVDRAEAWPALLLHATPADVPALADLADLAWLGRDLPLEWYMDRSSGTIDAPRNWYSEVQQADGDRSPSDWNTQGATFGIDGRDITVVVVDTGIDGDHPDFDYGEKLLLNLWKDCDDPCPWVEHRNTDTTYGHGTHVAGTIAGNGDASGGIKRGVAPAANLIGVGGDWTPVYWSIIQGLGWTYNHSLPGNNPDNIRIVSNSWGDGAGTEYEPEHPITALIQALTWENNVVVTFAAGNDGTDNHDGEVITTNLWSMVPSAISVAASTRDGDGMAVFSSRGQADLVQTWPDVSAPGVSIDSTAARGTFITAATTGGGQSNPYYYAISGTSMATPHVSGVVALMLQAAPSLRMSSVHEDGPVAYAAGSVDPWYTADGVCEDTSCTMIHEAELILKLSAEPITATADNGVPGTAVDRVNGRAVDFAQGYGLVNITRALEIALTLQTLRDPDGDGSVDRPEVTVQQAAAGARGVSEVRDVRLPTDRLRTQWHGEWTHMTNRSNPVQQMTSDQQRVVVLPAASTGTLTMGLSWETIRLDEGMALADVALVYRTDEGEDWSYCLEGEQADGWRRCDVAFDTSDLTEPLEVWFDVRGVGAGLTVPTPLSGEFAETRVVYRAELAWQQDGLAQGDWVHLEDDAWLPQVLRWDAAEPSASWAPGQGLVTERLVHDLGRAPAVLRASGSLDETSGSALGAWIVLLISLGVAGLIAVLAGRRLDEDGGDPVDDTGDAVLEAESIAS